MIRILIALAAGMALGPFLGGPAGAGSVFLEISKGVIQLIKAVAVPLLFCAITNAVTKAEVTLRHGARLFTVALMNALIALFIGIGIAHVFKPGLGLREIWSAGAGQSDPGLSLPKVDFLKTISAWIPQSVMQPFSENAVIPGVILALLLGAAIRREGEGATSIRVFFESAQRLSERILFWITKLIPLAVFAAVASSVAKYGFAPLIALFPYLGVGLLGLLIHILLTYQAWIRLFAKTPLSVFWREAKEPVVQAVATNSSLATLPFTLRALDRLGISRQSSALGACVGTNLNNDGIILYEGMALFFVAQAMGLDLTLTQQLAGAFLCIVTAMGIAGVPEAGFISLALVLTTVGISTENLTLLLSVDWILGRARSVTNVLSDMVVSIALDQGNRRSDHDDRTTSC
ncbi:MAG: cation:dicarboxylase symporter family transporter [Bdellovibrionales bacterium]|nr:cation:dicarboxylase symporter family transporter [Bdellovibrionales bacterium]